MGYWGQPAEAGGAATTAGQPMGAGGGATTTTGEDIPLANLRAYQMGAADATRMASVGMVPAASVHRMPQGMELLERKIPEATYGK